MRRNIGMYIDSVVFLKQNVTIGHIDATLVFGSPDRTSTAPVHQYCKLNPGEKSVSPEPVSIGASSGAPVRGRPNRRSAHAIVQHLTQNGCRVPVPYPKHAKTALR